MKDFPVFSTDNGVGSLVFREIPYSGKAYLKIQSVSDLMSFLRDCTELAGAVGAKSLYASGNSGLSEYPLHTVIYSMRCMRDQIPVEDGALFPVTSSTLKSWGEIYNRKMSDVPNAAYMSQRALEELLDRGEGYFIHKECTLFGIGSVSGNKIGLVASVVPGGGRKVVCALANAVFADTVELEVSSQNKKAIALYDSLGFVMNGEISRWYQIF